jgi:CheY-like chemotaxis protein
MNTTKKVLLVDDDIDVITIVSTILKKEGFTVFTAGDKTTGLAVALKEKPDVAILDVMMTTHFEGFELAKSIADNSSLVNTRVLMQTSIDIMTTTNPSVQSMAREFRKDSTFKELQVLLIKDILTGNAGIDYLSQNGENIWVPVTGFIRKPVESTKLLSELNKIFPS